MSEYPLEGYPTDDQKLRLQDWLSELRMVCRKYRIVIETDPHDVTRIVDLDRATTIGIGVTAQVAQRAGRQRITSYDATDSILDGMWLVDTPTGVREQRHVGPVWPTHPLT